MKNTATIIRPVSRKAYARFVERITLVFSDVDKINAMLAALDAYLGGNRDTYAGGLTPECALAFEMLRFEIDTAMARSAKARMRARKCRPVELAGVSQVKVPVGMAVPERHEESPVGSDRAYDGSDDGSDDESKGGFTVPMTRRQRRAVRRGLSGKSRWRKISG